MATGTFFSSEFMHSFMLAHDFIAAVLSINGFFSKFHASFCAARTRAIYGNYDLGLLQFSDSNETINRFSLNLTIFDLKH